jgi:hypothetical protein
VRIAVSGTHGSGKTTLVEDFAAAHPGYVHVPEPFETLSERGVAFSDPPTVADYLEQLESSIATLHGRESEADVIFDRCPLDFVAYLSVLGRRAGSEAFDVDSVLEDVADAIDTLDLIVFLPLPPGGAMEAEYPALQRAVDRELRSILRDDSLSLFASGKPRLVTLGGAPGERLQALERAISRHPSPGATRS